jgi:hypothetical protein
MRPPRGARESGDQFMFQQPIAVATSRAPTSPFHPLRQEVSHDSRLAIAQVL